MRTLYGISDFQPPLLSCPPWLPSPQSLLSARETSEVLWPILCAVQASRYWKSFPETVGLGSGNHGLCRGKAALATRRRETHVWTLTRSGSAYPSVRPPQLLGSWR